VPTASEIGEFVFCRRAWGYRRRGAPAADDSARRQGLAWHREQAGRVVQARRVRRAGVLLLALAGGLALVGSLALAGG
jgi:hypothetical protein